MRVFSFLATLYVCACQFINSPEPFNPADTYVAPTATSVFSFGGAIETSLSIAVDSAASPSVPVYEPSTSPKSTVVDSTSHLEVQPLSTALPVVQKPATRSIPAITNPTPPGNDVVVTVMNTFYTTVSCSTSSTSASEPAAARPLPKVTSADSHATSQSATADATATHTAQGQALEPTSLAAWHPSPVSAASVSTSPGSTSISTSPACDAHRVTVYSTLWKYTTETSSSTVKVKATDVTTIAL